MAQIPHDEPHYYDAHDVMYCEQHAEVKRLANKLKNKWWATCQRTDDMMLGDAPYDERKFKGLTDKADKIWTEFLNCERGIDRCCGFQWRDPATGLIPKDAKYGQFKCESKK